MDWDQDAIDRLIPRYMQGGLRRWIEYGTIPGSFLQAVLKNDFVGAVTAADDVNLTLLGKYVKFLHNHAPEACYGSKRKFDDWHKRKCDEQAKEAMNDRR